MPGKGLSAPQAHTSRRLGVERIPKPPTYSAPDRPEALRRAAFLELSVVSSSFSFELESQSFGPTPCVNQLVFRDVSLEERAL
jgi:hypothetical protein